MVGVEFVWHSVFLFGYDVQWFLLLLGWVSGILVLRVAMPKTFKDSVKALQADIGYANSVASTYPVDNTGAYYQMRLRYIPASQLLLSFLQLTHCRVAGYFGLLKVIISMIYYDGKTRVVVHERKATLKEFCCVILPSIKLLDKGISDVEDKKQRETCMQKFSNKDVEDLSAIDLEREEECGICMETNPKVVLPKCTHVLCMKCFRDWYIRDKSCPFCRENLQKLKDSDLWVLVDQREIVDSLTICEETLKRLCIFINKLPLVTGTVTGAGACNHRIRR